MSYSYTWHTDEENEDMTEQCSYTQNISSCEINARKNFGPEWGLIIYRYIRNPQSDQIPVGLIAELVEHCTGITKVIRPHYLRVS